MEEREKKRKCKRRWEIKGKKGNMKDGALNGDDKGVISESG